MTQPRRLVIVESPAKAAKIGSYLGNDYIVKASRGHIRDLPGKAAEVPAKYKGEKWASTGVNVDDKFKPIYVVNPDKKATLKELKDDLKQVDELYLATDEDREGEAIAWHLLQELKPKVPVRRMVFHEITPAAIQDAVANTRELDNDLVDAQETRRILDRLYGYEVSPVLWKKVMPRLSAGRVQSVATRLIVDRERERMAFIPAGYWDIDAMLDAGEQASPRIFASHLTTLDGSRIASGRDFSARGKVKGDVIVLDETAALSLAKALPAARWSVAGVEAKPYTRRPAAPFRTTTMQQEAGRKLGFTTDRSMRVAQSLYEGGHITYMRTDSVVLSSQAISAARSQAEQLYGREYVPEQPRHYASKVKNAQEAHEAIRPAGEHFRTPAQTGLRGDEFRLYELIWQRTIASQMADATGQSVSVKIDAELAQRVPVAAAPADVQRAGFVSSGRTITFPGFLKAYVESTDEPDSESEARLPKLTPGQHLSADSIKPEGHQTRPPARYTEPTLVAKLEELEIGRPSTYASIIRTITSRDYVFKKGTALVPTWLAFAVTSLLEKHFPNLVDYTFTASMESQLDEIARGDAKRLDVLSDFYFGADGPDSAASANAGLHDLVTNLGDIDARALSTFAVGDLDSGISVRVGRFGTYVEDEDEHRANVPDDLAPDDLTVEVARELLSKPMGESRELGRDPLTHTLIVARNGRFGPYVTEVLDEDAEAKPKKGVKPRTGSLFKDMTTETVTLDEALRLLSLPREVGTDDDGQLITSQNGRYGPYLKKGTDSRSLTSESQIFSITLEEARQIFAQPKVRGRAAAVPPLKELGEDPNTGRAVVVKDGRFGPYITDGEYNVTVPKSDTIESLTLDRASELLFEKRAQGPAPKRKATRATSTSKTTARKPAAGTARTVAAGTSKTSRAAAAKKSAPQAS